MKEESSPNVTRLISVRGVSVTWWRHSSWLVSFDTNTDAYSCSEAVFVPEQHTLCLFLYFPQIGTRSSKSVAIIVAVVVIMLLSIAGGVVFVRKYVCGGR